MFSMLAGRSRSDNLFCLTQLEKKNDPRRNVWFLVDSDLQMSENGVSNLNVKAVKLFIQI